MQYINDSGTGIVPELSYISIPGEPEPVLRMHCALTGSTNDDAKRYARENRSQYRNGDVIIFDAAAQSGGRGQREHAWASGVGLGLYMTLLIFTNAEPRRAQLLSLTAPLAVRRAVLRLAGEGAGTQIGVKHPNDVMARTSGTGWRKLGGILTETACGGDVGGSCAAAKLEWAALGVGINLRHGPGDFPPELRDIAVSLAQLGVYGISTEVALTAVCGELLPLARGLFGDGEMDGGMLDALRQEYGEVKMDGKMDDLF